MNKDAKSKRLDKIEVQLTPKQWAIRLADEMGRYPSQEDHLKAIMKGTYRQSPFTKPFYTLAQQAKEHWPQRSVSEVSLNCKLRMEFHALKLLINQINTEIKLKAETNRLKAALQSSKLHTLSLQDAFTHVIVAETMSGSSTSPTRLRLISLLEAWADDSAKLLVETTAHKAAVQTVQEKYFERHPILYKDNELEIELASRAVRDAIAAFNKYLKARAKLYNREPGQEQHKAEVANVMLFEREGRLPIDIEVVEASAEIYVDIIVQKWVKHAETRGTADILQETGKHEDYIWGHARNEMGLDPKSGMRKPLGG